MGAPVRRIELWEPEVHTGNPLAFNAVITEAGVVDVQQVEWQIEHRYHFILEPAVTASLFAAFATLSPSSPPEDAKILMFIGDEGQRRGFAAEGEVYASVRSAITPKGIKPTKSRGPTPNFNWPFP